MWTEPICRSEDRSPSTSHADTPMPTSESDNALYGKSSHCANNRNHVGSEEFRRRGGDVPREAGRRAAYGDYGILIRCVLPSNSLLYLEHDAYGCAGLMCYPDLLLGSTLSRRRKSWIQHRGYLREQNLQKILLNPRNTIALCCYCYRAE
jgi:hypothetical protein